MDYISIFATSSYVETVGLCCGGRKKISRQKSPRCSLGGHERVIHGGRVLQKTIIGVQKIDACGQALTQPTWL
jgi:hypothetical protein